MPKKQSIRVIKVPLPSHERPIDRPMAFPRMPRLYLELLENKNKIKQELVNKEYVSSHADAISDKPVEIEEVHDLPPPKKSTSDVIELDDEDEIHKPQPEEKRRDRTKNEPFGENDNLSPVVIPETEEPIGDDNLSIASSSDLSDRLKQLLAEDGSSTIDTGSPPGEDKYSKRRERSRFASPVGSVGGSPPTLAQLEQNGEYAGGKTMPNIGHASEPHSEDDKRELLFKFDLLRKSYNNASIPEFTIHSDYEEMKKVYESTLRRVTLDSSVESYKTYLIGGFMVVEWILGKFLKFDMQGFTQQQIVTMSSYEKLLIELGEKSYVPEGSKWPVEIRLLGLIIMNAAFFVISKMIMRSTGANLMGMINGMNTAAPTPRARKRRMRGPNIDLDDIPDVDDVPQDNEPEV